MISFYFGDSIYLNIHSERVSEWESEREVFHIHPSIHPSASSSYGVYPFHAVFRTPLFKIKINFHFFIPFYNSTSFILKIYSSRFNHDIFLSFLSLPFPLDHFLTDSYWIRFTLYCNSFLSIHFYHYHLILESFSSWNLTHLFFFRHPIPPIPLNEIPMRHFPQLFQCLSFAGFKTSLFHCFDISLQPTFFANHSSCQTKLERNTCGSNKSGWKTVSLDILF